MPGYSHLDRPERDQIADLKAQGLGVTAIARAVGRHPSTI
ncbi:MAG: helix-turn-helix domain-containing protein, partial [Paracoccaceae bacterium]